MFPPHIAQVLDSFGVCPATKAALDDLYLQIGSPILDVFAEFSDQFASPAHIQPEDIARLRIVAAQAYLRNNHASWRRMEPTASFYCPRFVQGMAAGLVKPLGNLAGQDGFAGRVAQAAMIALPPRQSLPTGLLLLTKNGHFGGREDTVAFDIVPGGIDDAIAVASGLGRQHTTPGSLGECSSNFDIGRQLALIWEIQPNIYKPNATRNQALSKIWRHNRNWHVTTLVAALLWYEEQHTQIFILRGQALPATHEINPREPMTQTIVQLHDATVQSVLAPLGATLAVPTAADARSFLESGHLMNGGLRRFVAAQGATAAIWKVEIHAPKTPFIPQP